MGIRKLLLTVSAVLVALASTSASAMKWPSFLTRRRQYTPLVMFSVNNEASKKLDKAVREIEEELDVRVERIDALRNPHAKVLMGKLTKRSAPFLYHRESLQIVPFSNSTQTDRIRAWAKGRYLPSQRGLSGTQSSSSKVFSQEDSAAMDQAEMLKDMDMTPLQKSGKDAIKERTEEKIKESSR